MSKDTNENYAETIRQMIKNEDEVRNQRTNWFLVIQGFLIAGICDSSCTDIVLKFFISIIGFITSISFWHAAWRSTLATTYALSWWKVNKGKESEENLPPVSLITKDILDVNKEGNEYFDKEIYNTMCSEMDKCTKWKADTRNGLDCLLPYRLLPYVFFFFWIIYIVYLFIWK